MKTPKILESRECDVCREALFLVDYGDDRVVATDRKDGQRHVCFDLPADANLLIMEDK